MRKAVAGVGLAALMTLGMGGTAFAGESTGNFSRTGKTTPVADFVMHSICAFSGQNPEAFLPPTDPDFEPGRTQSWGQIPKSVRDTFPAEMHPGIACNGNHGVLAGGGTE